MLFTVVIPLYNKSDTIGRALKSVRGQSHRDFEVVVVDDGSTDEGAEIVERFEGIDSLRIVRQKNAGVSAARNRGVLESRGQYVAFLDADDYWLDGHLSALAHLVEQCGSPAVVGTGFFWHCGQQVLKTRETGRISCVDFIRETAYFQPVHTSSVAIRKDVFEEVGGFDVQHGYYEDLELLFKIALKYPDQFYVMRRALVVHMDDAQTSITKGSAKHEFQFPHLEVIAGQYKLVRPYLLKMLCVNAVRLRVDRNKELTARCPALPFERVAGGCFLSWRMRFAVIPFAISLRCYIWLRVRMLVVRMPEG